MMLSWVAEVVCLVSRDTRVEGMRELVIELQMNSATAWMVAEMGIEKWVALEGMVD